MPDMPAEKEKPLLVSLARSPGEEREAANEKSEAYPLSKAIKMMTVHMICAYLHAKADSMKYMQFKLEPMYGKAWIRIKWANDSGGSLTINLDENDDEVRLIASKVRLVDAIAGKEHTTPEKVAEEIHRGPAPKIVMIKATALEARDAANAEELGRRALALEEKKRVLANMVTGADGFLFRRIEDVLRGKTLYGKDPGEIMIAITLARTQVQGHRFLERVSALLSSLSALQVKPSDLHTPVPPPLTEETKAAAFDEALAKDVKADPLKQILALCAHIEELEKKALRGKRTLSRLLKDLPSSARRVLGDLEEDLAQSESSDNILGQRRKPTWPERR